MKLALHRFALLLAMLLAFIHANAYLIEVSGLYYSIDLVNNATVVEITSDYEGAVVIPQTVENSGVAYSVTSIGNYAFDGCTGLTSVTIPNSVTSIGDYAFRDCTGLTSVTIPNSVTSIGNYAFSGCYNLIKSCYPSDLSNPFSHGIAIKYPRKTAKVGEDGSVLSDECLYFVPYNLEGEYIIPQGVTSIGDYAFYKCTGITSVTIPNSVTSIGSEAFSGCAGLTSVVIPNSVTSIGNYAFSDCTGLTSVTIPDSVTSIGSSAFSGCSCLASVTIPNSVTSIGSKAFSDCTALTSIKIPDSVETIGGSAFSDCTGLTSVVIGNSVTSIEADTFKDCTGLTSVVIGNSVTSIEADTFKDCTGLTSVVIGNSVTSIEADTFKDCTGLIKSCYPSGLSNPFPTGITIEYPREHARVRDDGVVLSDYGWLYFVPCDIEGEYIIPKEVGRIEARAFMSCTGLTSITIPNSVKFIMYSAFSGCTGLTSVIIPNSVTEIDSVAFCDCTGLTSVIIPDSVTSIGVSAFEGCTGLTSVTIPESVEILERDAFKDCTKLVSAVFNARYCLNVYNPNNHTDYTIFPPSLTEFKFGNEVTVIPDYLLKGCSDLTSIEIPNSVTELGRYAFSGCSNLTDVVLSDSLKCISRNAFEGCSALESITIPKSVEKIEESAFKDTPLATLNLSGKAPSIYDDSFSEVTFETAAVDFNPEYSDSFGISPSWEKFKSLSGRTTNIKYPSNLVADFIVSNYVQYSPTCYIVSDYLKDRYHSTTPPGKVVPINTFHNGWYPGVPITDLAGNYEEVYRNPYGGSSCPLTILNRTSGTSYGQPISNYEKELAKPASFKAEIKDVKFIDYSPADGYTVTVDYEIRSGFSNRTPVRTAVVVTQDNVAGIEYHQSNDYSYIMNYIFSSQGPLYPAKDYAEAFFNKYGKSTIPGGEMVFNDVNRGIWPDVKGELFTPEWKKDVPCHGQITVTGLKGVSDAMDPLMKNDFNFIILVMADEPNEYVYPILASDIKRGDVPQTVFDDNMYEYKVTDDGLAYLVGMPEGVKDMKVPAEFENAGVHYNVAGIMNKAMVGHKDIETASLPGGIGIVSDLLFSGCTYLREVEIADGVSTIGAKAFSGCESLTYISLPASLTSIGKNAFSDCTSLQGVVLPPCLTSIGTDAFSGCKAIIKATYPNSFSNPFVSGVTIAYPAESVIQSDGLITDKDFTTVYCAPFNYRGECILPSTVTSIAENAFNGCFRLTSITFPDDLTQISAYAFKDCTRLSSVNFGKNLAMIGESAFQGCFSLTDLSLPNALQSIGNSAFSECSKLKAVSFGLNLKEIGDEAFMDCIALGEVALPGSVTVIGSRAFYGCKALTAVTLPGSVTLIGSRAFGECYAITDFVIKEGVGKVTFSNFALPSVSSLYLGKDFAFTGSFTGTVKTLTLGNNVTSIADNAFKFSKIETLVFGSSVKSIGSHAFEYCEIKELTLSPATETVGDYAFSGCNLTSVTLGANVKKIGSRAFELSSDATGVFVTAINPPNAPNDAFNNYNVPLHLTPGSEDAYYDYPTCWFRFENLPMIVAEKVMMDAPSDLSGVPGDTFQLNAKAYPENCTLSQIFWSSSNPAIATVDQQGKVTIVKNNEIATLSLDDNASCTIFAHTLYSDTPVATCDIQVADAPTVPLATSILIEPDVLDAEVGRDYQLSVAILPQEASSQKVIWESSNPAVATVTSSGLVSVISAGAAVITASTTDGSGLKGECRIDFSTGIGVIETADSRNLGAIYSITGLLLKSDATPEDIKQLPKGIYIVGGKKLIKM